MTRLPINFVGLATVGCMASCAREYEPAQPWYIPAGNDDDGDGGDESSVDEATQAASAAEDGGDAADGTPPDADDGDPPPPMDDGGVSADDGGESSESSAAETGAPMDSPYEGGWDIGGCQSDIGPANNQVGGILEDFTFTDQFGDQVRLYDFCHKAVLIAEGAFW